MKIDKYLEIVANIVDSDIKGDNNKIYVSKYNHSYITRVGMECDVKFLCDRLITDELQHGIGFSPADQKWYGWSHRAIFGFSIGSTCKKGDCHYNGSSLEEQEIDAIRFWEDDDHVNTWCAGIIERNNNKFFDIRWLYNNKVPNKKLRCTISGVNHFIGKLGRGEWTAKTIEDAKIMAVDFNKGVS